GAKESTCRATRRSCGHVRKTESTRRPGVAGSRSEATSKQPRRHCHVVGLASLALMARKCPPKGWCHMRSNTSRRQSTKALCDSKILDAPGFTLVISWLSQKWLQKCQKLAPRGTKDPDQHLSK